MNNNENKCTCDECQGHDKKNIAEFHDVAPMQNINNSVMNHKQQITIDDFAKLEFKVGKILECEKVENADKLLKSRIKLGDEIRTIVSGIALYYKPEEMVGKSVVVVANLKPAKLRGIMSEGMILCAQDENGLKVISPEGDIMDGAEVR